MVFDSKLLWESGWRMRLNKHCHLSAPKRFWYQCKLHYIINRFCYVLLSIYCLYTSSVILLEITAFQQWVHVKRTSNYGFLFHSNCFTSILHFVSTTAWSCTLVAQVIKRRGLNNSILQVISICFYLWMARNIPVDFLLNTIELRNVLYARANYQTGKSSFFTN